MLRDGDPAESTLLTSGTFSNDRGTEILLCVADNVLISSQEGGKARINGYRGTVDRSVLREPVLLGSSRRGGGKANALREKLPRDDQPRSNLKCRHQQR